MVGQDARWRRGAALCQEGSGQERKFLPSPFLFFDGLVYLSNTTLLYERLRVVKSTKMKLGSRDGKGQGLQGLMPAVQAEDKMR